MYIKIKKISLITLVCLATISIIFSYIKEACYTYVQASSLFMGDGQTKAVVISVDYLELEDIAENNYFKNIYDRSYSAFISSRQTGKATAAKVKLSIGSSKKLNLNNASINAVNFNDVYMGQNREGVVYKNIDELKNLNCNSEYLTYIGYLGNKLEKSGKQTCVIGNSDTNIINRDDILIAMNSSGYTDYGDVESTILFDPSFPGGKRTDFAMLIQLYNKYLPLSDFIVVDTGDLSRLEYYRSKLSHEQYQIIKKQAINRISEFIKDITQTEGAGTTFFIMSAYPSSNGIKSGNKLTQLISYEAGKAGGLLYSESTRRNGIITSLDIADYIIEKLNPKEKSLLREINVKDSLNKALQLKKRLLEVSLMRLPILTWYAILEIICAVMGLLYMLSMRFIKGKRLLGLIKSTLLANICAPVVLLYMAAFDITNPYLFFLLFLVFSYIIVYIINSIFHDTISRFAAAAFVVNISLTADLFSSSLFIKGSIFGYDPIIGARFYGIGNEFAGVYLGSSILLAGCMLQRLKEHRVIKPAAIKLLFTLYFAFQIYIIGMPSKGANFGATIALVFGSFFFINTMIGKHLNVRRIIFLAFIIALVIGLIILVDLSNLNRASHIGKFIADIKENGMKVLIATLRRKLAMNVRLIKYTIWTKVLLCIILIITIMFFKPVKLLRGIFKKYHHLATAWLGISAASIAGLIVNDSGIVMAATAMIFTGFTILYICLEEMETEKTGG